MKSDPGKRINAMPLRQYFTCTGKMLFAGLVHIVALFFEFLEAPRERVVTASASYLDANETLKYSVP